MFQAFLEPSYSTMLTSIDTDLVLFSLSVTACILYKVLLILWTPSPESSQLLDFKGTFHVNI